MKKGSSRAMKRIYISGIISGIFVCLIIILLLQFFGVIPRWWSTGKNQPPPASRRIMTVAARGEDFVRKSSPQLRVKLAECD